MAGPVQQPALDLGLPDPPGARRANDHDTPGTDPGGRAQSLQGFPQAHLVGQQHRLVFFQLGAQPVDAFVLVITQRWCSNCGH
jgi:hypothetical protein